jgi:hypothetical protein
VIAAVGFDNRHFMGYNYPASAHSRSDHYADNVVAGHTYYCKLEDVELDGSDILHLPVKVTAQLDHNEKGG